MIRKKQEKRQGIVHTYRGQQGCRKAQDILITINLPHSISKNEKALECYRSCMEEIQKCASYLTEECKIPKEDVAMMLPLGMETKVVDKRNLRNFLDMCKQRLCTRAYWEYRELMREILSELRKISPEWEEIVDNYCKSKCDFLKYCPEKKSCGRYPVK